jgi:hypothetical protein
LAVSHRNETLIGRFRPRGPSDGALFLCRWSCLLGDADGAAKLHRVDVGLLV